MAYPYFGVNGDLNYCYLFMQEVEKCFNAKLYPQTRCKNEVEDFLECHNRQKHRAALKKANEAMMNATNVNVPHYNWESDSFVYDDGKVISNSDPVFKEYKWF